jgi:hypothetical protein
MAEQTLSSANLSDPRVRRRVFLDIALRRARPGTGSALSLLLMKVMASRTQDLADASRMLGLASHAERQATREVFARWWPGALEDLESLIVLGELETGT